MTRTSVLPTAKIKISHKLPQKYNRRNNSAHHCANPTSTKKCSQFHLSNVLSTKLFKHKKTIFTVVCNSHFNASSHCTISSISIIWQCPKVWEKIHRIEILTQEWISILNLPWDLNFPNSQEIILIDKILWYIVMLHLLGFKILKIHPSKSVGTIL